MRTTHRRCHVLTPRNSRRYPIAVEAVLALSFNFISGRPRPTNAGIDRAIPTLALAVRSVNNAVWRAVRTISRPRHLRMTAMLRAISIAPREMLVPAIAMPAMPVEMRRTHDRRRPHETVSVTPEVRPPVMQAVRPR
jgi:hypothetical protein